MKMKPKNKFLVGMAAYALLHTLCCLFFGPRAMIWILGITAALCFARMLWMDVHRRRKRLLTGLVIASLVFLPVKPVPAQEKDMVIFVCGMLVVGVIIVGGLYYTCKKLPPPGACTCGCGLVGCSCADIGQSAVGPLAPTVGNIVTNPPAVTAPAAKMPPLYYEGYGNPGGSFVDGQGQPWTFLDAWSVELESSTNLVNWTKRFKISAFNINTGGLLVSLSTNGVPVFSAFYTNPLNPANSMPVEITSNPKEFFRIACQ
jgi:hypothetical protein